jgi:hypothetical protein
MHFVSIAACHDDEKSDNLLAFRVDFLKSQQRCASRTKQNRTIFLQKHEILLPVCQA